MNKKRFVQGLAISMLITTVLGGGLTNMVYANTAEAANNKVVTLNNVGNENGTMAAKVVWVYKEVGRKKYMRLYDATNKKWLTDWILCN